MSDWVERLRLFLGIVWRERYDGRPMPIGQAWEVACAMYPMRWER